MEGGGRDEDMMSSSYTTADASSSGRSLASSSSGHPPVVMMYDDSGARTHTSNSYEHPRMEQQHPHRFLPVDHSALARRQQQQQRHHHPYAFVVPFGQAPPLSSSMTPSPSYTAVSSLPSEQHHSMQNSNSSSGGCDNLLSLKRDREREGRCSECGVQTHEFRIDHVTGKHVKVPMTVQHEVHRGRCLLCYPISVLSCEQTMATMQSPTSQSSSSRSLTTISTLGNSSAPGNYQQQQQQRHYHHSTPDPIDSSSSCTGETTVAATSTVAGAATASIVTNDASSSISSSAPVVQDTLRHMQDDSCDLLELLTAMRQFPAEHDIQEVGLERLWIQSWDDDTSLAIGRVGGIATILQAMTSFAHSPMLQQYGCEALQNLALNNEYNRDVMVELGGIQAVVNAMNAHLAVVGVQQAGCTALANLAMGSNNNNNSSSSTANHRAAHDYHVDIASAGGLHAIVNAARTYSDEDQVLRAAYQALRAMGYDPQRHGGSAQAASPQERQLQDDTATMHDNDIYDGEGVQGSNQHQDHHHHHQHPQQSEQSRSARQSQEHPAQAFVRDGQQATTTTTTRTGANDVIRLDAYGFPI